MQIELTNEFLDQVKEAIELSDPKVIKNLVGELHFSDVSAILDELDREEGLVLVRALDTDLASDAIMELDEDDQIPLIKELEPDELSRFIGRLESDDAADLLQNLPVRKREETLSLLSNGELAKHILDLLHYEEDCAGGLMAKELVKANINWTVVQTIDEIRRQAERVEKIYSIYVVNDIGELLGRVGLKNIILAHDKTLIKDIYDQDVISVETFVDEGEVANVMQKYDLDALPVVNFQGKLVGRITIDDIIDVITEQAELERQIMSGITSNIEEDDSVWMLSKARLPWLMIGMFGGLLGAQFIGLFEGDLSLIPAMAFFIPLITATGGNVGIQSSTIIVQSLANQTGFNTGHFERLIKITLVALMNGLILSSMVFGINMLLGQSLMISSVVSIALFSVILLASVLGTFTPLALDKFGFNPALASGPFITTANDLLGLGVYFLVAHFLLGL